MSGYFEFWHLNSPVFSPKEGGSENLFLPSSHQPIFERTKSLCQKGDSLILISGEAGVGKGTMGSRLFHSLPILTHEVLTLQLAAEPTQADWLTPQIMNYFALPQGNFQSLYQSFDDLIDENRHLTLIVSGSEFLNKSWQPLYDLYHFQSVHRPKINLVLFSVDENILIGSPFAGKAEFSAELPRLSQNDAFQYVSWQLKLAGLRENTFTPGAIKIAYQFSQGNFKKLNATCENALIEAAIANSKTVSENLIRAGLGAESPAPETKIERTSIPIKFSDLFKDDEAS